MRRSRHRLASMLAAAALALAALPSVAQAPAAPARMSLLPLAQPLWSELTPAQQDILAPFSDEWNGWPVERKRHWVALANRFPRMAPADRAKARERIKDWAALSPRERERARLNFRIAKAMPPEQRSADWLAYQALTPEQQATLRAIPTSNTAARHAGMPTGLARQAARPLDPSARPQPIVRPVPPAPSATAPAAMPPDAPAAAPEGTAATPVEGGS